MPISERQNRATIGATAYSLPNNSTTLTPIDEVGAYTVALDLSAMTVTEQYEIVILAKIDVAGSQLPLITSVVTGTTAPTLIMPNIPLHRAWDVQVKKLAGTDRSIGWSITRFSA